jgi:NAD(P)-dependent dehydrogenase (short-subunit alcohol dehydrogenase family)
MRRKGNGGSIINFTTIEAHRGAGSFAVYAGAKAALTNFTRALAVELAPEGIRVNCVVPDTSPSKTSANSLQPELLAANARIKPGQWDRMWPLYVPQGYCPPVEDLAKGVLYLASDLSTSVTGLALHIDGGTFASSGFLNWPDGVGLLPCAQGDALDKLYPAQDGDEVSSNPGSSFLAG